jgi:hypothetical protein
MKVVITLLALVIIMVGFNGCYTIPHHFADNEEIVYYPPPPSPPPDYFPSPLPLPPPTYYPPAPEPEQPKIRQPENPRDDRGSSYGDRDPLRGNGGRGNGEINTVPPVRMPDRNDGGSR